MVYFILENVHFNRSGCKRQSWTFYHFDSHVAVLNICIVLSGTM